MAPASLLFAEIGAFLTTYVVHSTLLLGAARMWLAWRPLSAPLREAALKTALLGGLATAALQAGSPWRLHYMQWTVDIARHESPAALAPAGLALAFDSRHHSNAPSDAQEPFDGGRGDSTWWSSALSDAAGAVGLAAMQFVACVWLLSIIPVGAHWLWLRRELAAIQRRSSACRGGMVHARLATMLARFRTRRRVQLLVAREHRSPMTVGSLASRIVVPRAFLRRLDERQLDALFAHEVAHVVRRDPLWNQLAWLLASIFWMQPLNAWAWRRLRTDAEFLADRLAAEILADDVALARCLASLGEWLVQRPAAPARTAVLAVGMASFHSMLGRRVEALVDGALAAPRPTAAQRLACWGQLALLLAAVAIAGPHVGLATEASAASAARDAEGSFARAPHSVSQTSVSQSISRSTPMHRTFAAITVAAAFATHGAAAEPEKAGAPDKAGAPTVVKVEAVPKGMQGFSGQLTGELVSKDIERGEFVLRVRKVERTWKANTSTKPQEGEGKLLQVKGVAGRWLDALLTIKPGTMVRVEARHYRGGELTFIPEGFSAVDVSQSKQPSAESSTSGFPDGMRGFRGILTGTLVSKDFEKGVLVFKADSVKRVWTKNAAKDTDSAKGRTFTVTNISGKWLDALLGLNVGDRIEVEAFHNGGEKLDFPGEWLKKAE